MGICVENDWSMDLVKYNRPPDEKESFVFKDLKIVNEMITGKVYDAKGNFVSELHGTCCPFGPGIYLGRLTFFFTAKGKKDSDIEIFILGWAFRFSEDEQPAFRGGFVVRGSTTGSQAGAAVNFEVGDTGTGTGMQAQITIPPRTQP